MVCVRGVEQRVIIPPTPTHPALSLLLGSAGKSGEPCANLPSVSSTCRAVHLLWSVRDLCRLSHPGHGTK